MSLRLSGIVVGLLLLTCAAPAADEPPAKIKKLLGTWERTDSAFKVTLQFKADEAIITIKAGDISVSVEGEYSVAKDGTIFGVVTRNTAGEGPEKGEALRFDFKVDKNKATLTQLKPAADHVKLVIEGEYKRMEE